MPAQSKQASTEPAVKVTYRLPKSLLNRLDADLAERKKTNRKFSANDLAIERLSNSSTGIGGFNKNAFAMVWPAIEHDIEIVNEDGSRKVVTIAEQEEAIQSTYPTSALEAAAQAEAPIGRSVTEFLLKTAPRIADKSVDATDKPGDEWQSRCVLDFGNKILELAARSMPGWKKMTWEQRHTRLKEQKESSADGW